MANRFLNNIKINDEYTLPSADGTADQIIKTDGAGQLSFIDQSTLVSGSAERVSILVKNGEGTALVKGDPVYIIGSVGASARLEVGLCDASDPSKMPCVGLLEQDLLNNGQGTAVTAGKLRNLITTPIDGQPTTENDTIYVKAGGSSGLALTTTKPTGSTNLIQNVGQVGRVSASSDGNFVVSAIMRTNDVPNLPTGKIWVGDGNTTVSTVVHLDETNGRMGVGTASPAKKLTIGGIGLGNTDGLKIEDPSNTAYGAHYSYDDGSTTVEIGGVVNNALRDCISIARDATRTITIDTSERVGIGTTSPQEKLHVQNYTTGESHQAMFKGGAVTVGDYSYISLNNGYSTEYNKEVRLAAVSEQSNSNKTGFAILTSPDSNGASGHERLRVTADGNVGIGTTNPRSKLHVEGVTGSVPALGAAASAAQIGGSTYGTLFSTLTSGTGVIQQGRSDGNTLTFPLLINPNGGNVGIGTTSPGDKLHVEGTVRADSPATSGWAFQGRNNLNTALSGIWFDNGDGELLLRDDANNLNVRLRSDSDSYFNGGNVGIGTTSPAQKLHVVGNSEITGDIYLGRYIFHDNDTNTWLGFPTSDTISFRTNGSDRMYINSSGNVGIGTTSPTSIFHVKQTLASPSVPMVYFEADRGPSAYGAVNVRVDNLDYGTGMRFVRSATYDSNAVSFYNGASPVGNININASSTSYNTSSDYRLKENLTKITDGIDRLKQLKPKRFNFIGETSIVDGFIAHEAKEVVPESVTGEKDEVLPNGDPVYQGIDQSKLVPLLTAALKEAITKIEELEARIQTLEKK